jgi:xanthine dehydrogenase molybdenum-binding subunit
MQSDSQQFRVIGTRPIRHDGVDKVTGRAKYGADHSLPDMLYAKVLRSPHAHARIVSINIDKALKVPGVQGIVTAEDLPELADGGASAGELRVNPRLMSRNILAREKVLYNGHAIAAVAATSLHIAEEALAHIEVEYELLAPVTDLEQAMAPDAPILLPTLRSKGDTQEQPTNVADHVQLMRGDIEAGFKSADYLVERELRTAMVHQGYIEPHNALAIYRSDGYLTIHCSTQGPFECRAMTAVVLGNPAEQYQGRAR